MSPPVFDIEYAHGHAVHRAVGHDIQLQPHRPGHCSFRKPVPWSVGGDEQPPPLRVVVREEDTAETIHTGEQTAVGSRPLMAQSALMR